MELDQQTREIIQAIERLGYRVEINRLKGRTKIATVAPDGDEEWGIAATPREAAIQLMADIAAAGEPPTESPKC